MKFAAIGDVTGNDLESKVMGKKSCSTRAE